MIGKRPNREFRSRQHLRIRQPTEKICATCIVARASIDATLAGAMQPRNCSDASSAAVRTDLSSQTHSVQKRSFIRYTKYLLI
jgi:hypothetical protein